jgi:Glycosyl transferase 4-like domain
MSGTRVGLVCGYLDPTRDGVADYTRQLAVHLRRTGLEPLVVTTYEWARAAGEGAVGVTERWDVGGVAAAAGALRRLSLDVVHVQFSPSVFGSSRAIGLLPLFLPGRIPLIVTLHEYGVWSGRGHSRRVRSALWSAAVTIRDRHSCRGNKRANATNTSRSFGSNRGRLTWRRSTATSCRNTSSDILHRRATPSQHHQTEHRPRHRVHDGEDHPTIIPTSRTEVSEPHSLHAAGEVSAQRAEQGPVGPVPTRLRFRSSQHATSCRSTSNSASFDADDRASTASQPLSRTKIR